MASRWKTWAAALAVAGAASAIPSHQAAAQADPPVHAVSWGANHSGQQGIGSLTPDLRTTFGAVNRAELRFAKVAAGAAHALAVAGDGTLWAWGANGDGQLGDGTTTNRPSPVQVPGPTNVVGISAGSGHSVAVTADGGVWTWGDNFGGQLGDGTTQDRPTPARVAGLPGAFAVAAGMDHTLAVLGDGTVRSWGRNLSGKLGDGTTTNRLTPVPVLGLTQVRSVSVGPEHNLALRADGRVFAWGNNNHGQLGDGTFETRVTAQEVGGLPPIAEVSAGFFYALARGVNGAVFGWGSNTSGQLGDGTFTDRLRPIRAQAGPVTQISAGDTSGAAVRTDGRVVAWGANHSGQLGDGTLTARPAPGLVTGLAKVRQVAAGGQFALAVQEIPQFALKVSPGSGTAGSGTSITVTVENVPRNGFSPTVSLSLSGLIAGMDFTLTPETLGPGETAELTIAGSGDVVFTPPRKVVIGIRGSAPGVPAEQAAFILVASG
ncbi:RCC1 domain-containing protein [Nonomuraea sp. NPDC050547]|uniref:RCC1 domain-containing protein n=1 Tax=Nonomuraea sp. NPDC050547 TaxID=3364368 RepID=UPI0037B8D5EA